MQLVRPFLILQFVPQKEGSQNKMQRRRRDAEKRVHPNVPKNSIKSTVGFVIRIHAGRHASDEIKAELKKLNLNHKYDAIFTVLDEKNIGTSWECEQSSTAVICCSHNYSHYQLTISFMLCRAFESLRCLLSIWLRNKQISG